MTFSLFVPECENAIYDAAKEMGQDYMYDFIVYVAEVHLSYINESYSISEKNRKSLKRKLSNEIGKYMSIEHPKTFRKRTLAMEISFFWSKICPDRREGFIKVYKNLYKNISVKVRLNEEAGGLDK